MDISAYLDDYVKLSAPLIERFFSDRLNEAGKIAPEAVEMLKMYRCLLLGGKKLRGALIKLGYEIAGGQEINKILQASISIEIIHAFLLIHDDIMDQDELRRGQPAIHKQFEKKVAGKGAVHFGISLAIDEGDIGCFLGHLALLQSGFSDELKVKAIAELDKILLDVGWGQALDIIYEHKKEISEEDILRVHRLKTGVYTGTGPLVLGAILAGADEKFQDKLGKFGLPLGIAFQVRDDEIGLFMDEEKIGKPSGSDIREDKNTLLKVKALELAKKEDKRFLLNSYGNSKINRGEIERVREITRASGAYAYSHQLGLRLVQQAKEQIIGLTENEKIRHIMTSLADFVMSRGK